MTGIVPPEETDPSIAASEVGAPRRKPLKRMAWLVLGLLLFGVVMISSGLDDLPRLSAIQPAWLAASMGFVLLSHFLFSARWSTLVNAQEGRPVLSTATGYYYSLSATAAGSVAAQMVSNLVVRAILLNRATTVSMSRSMLSVLIDKLADLVLILVYVPAVAVYFARPDAYGLMYVLVILGTLLYFFPAYGGQRLWQRLLYWGLDTAVTLLTQIPIIKRLKYVQQLRTLSEQNVWPTLSRQQMLTVIGLTVLGEIGLIGRSLFLAWALNIDAPLHVFVIGVVMGQISLFLGFTPGAIGVLEGSWYIALRMGGLSGEAISTFLITQRAFQTLMLGLIWLLVHVINMVIRSEPLHQPSRR